MVDPLEPAVLPNVLVRHVSWAKVVSAVDAVVPANARQGLAADVYIAHLAPDDVGDTPRLYRALVAEMAGRGWIGHFAVALVNQGQGNPVLRAILQRQVAVREDGSVTEAALQTLRNATEPFVNARSFFEGMEAARYRVCAVWVRKEGAARGKFVGTGFLVTPDLVLTARHVVDSLLETGPARFVAGLVVPGQEVPKPGSEARLGFAFDYWTGSGRFDQLGKPLDVTFERPKKAWLEWSSEKHPYDGVRHDFGPPDICKLHDCALVRLERPIGAALAGNSGGRMRGWVRIPDAPAELETGNAIAILQHPASGPQVFDKGRYRNMDAARARIWYETEASGGSSGSPCFDSGPSLVGFHNAGWPTEYQGETATCNQGVFIAQLLAGLPEHVLEASRSNSVPDQALWSLSEPPAVPEPVLGRREFIQIASDLFVPESGRRVLVVEQAKHEPPHARSGKSFSARILKALARSRAALVVEFRAEAIQKMPPESFLAAISQQMGMLNVSEAPPKPTDERQLSRWWSVDLPHWFGENLEQRARAGGMAREDHPASAVAGAGPDPLAGPALGKQHVLRELVWIAIDDLDRFPPEGGMKELIAGMMGVTDTESLIGPGLKSLRWLVIGHIPDFVRDRSIEYLRDIVSQQAIGATDWVECYATMFLALGREAEFSGNTAKALYDLSMRITPGIDSPFTRLEALAHAMRTSIESWPQPSGGPA